MKIYTNDLVKGHSDFKVKCLNFWSVYSGERFRASWPSCFALYLESKVGNILIFCFNVNFYHRAVQC